MWRDDAIVVTKLEVVVVVLFAGTEVHHRRSLDTIERGLRGSGVSTHLREHEPVAHRHLRKGSLL